MNTEPSSPSPVADTSDLTQQDTSNHITSPEIIPWFIVSSAAIVCALLLKYDKVMSSAQRHFDIVTNRISDILRQSTFTITSSADLDRQMQEAGYTPLQRALAGESLARRIAEAREIYFKLYQNPPYAYTVQGVAYIDRDNGFSVFPDLGNGLDVIFFDKNGNIIYRVPSQDIPQHVTDTSQQP